MPPTGKGVSNEAFLITCIKNPKEKVTIDFDSVAKLFGLSKGGAQNKFRAIMNATEDMETVPSTTKSNKRKASRPADDGDTSEKEPKPASKKTKAGDKGESKDTATVDETE